LTWLGGGEEPAGGIHLPQTSRLVAGGLLVAAAADITADLQGAGFLRDT
jgi:hypothetical protein